MKAVIVLNQKGGVGKSVFSYNFGDYLAQIKNEKTLFIDLDEQGNSTKALSAMHPSTLDAVDFFKKEKIVLKPNESNLYLAQATPALIALGAMVSSDQQNELVTNFKNRLQDVSGFFKYCVIDTPGANSVITNAPLLSANFTLIPSTIDNFALDVTITTLKRILNVQKHYNPGLVSLGILPTIFDATAPSQRANLTQFLSALNKHVLPVKLSKRTAFRDAADSNTSVFKVKTTSARTAAKEITDVFEHILTKMGN